MCILPSPANAVPTLRSPAQALPPAARPGAAVRVRVHRGSAAPPAPLPSSVALQRPSLLLAFQFKPGRLTGGDLGPPALVAAPAAPAGIGRKVPARAAAEGQVLAHGVTRLSWEGPGW